MIRAPGGRAAAWTATAGRLVPGAIMLGAIMLALAAAARPAAERGAPPWRAAADGVWHDIGCPWQPEGGRRLDCGVLEVPENRADPLSRTIYLHVRIFRARRPSGLPPVLFLNGGPGQAMDFEDAEGVAGWADYLDRVMPWSGERDVILPAQRGTLVRGVGLACPELGDPRVYLGATERPGPPTDWVANLRRADSDCRARLGRQGHDLAGYSTTENARDMVALRRALGVGQWMLYGVSYGTRLGFEILRQDPGGVWAAVFDSVFPPQVTAHWHDPAPFVAALGALIANCAADPLCDRAFPDLGRRLDRLLERLAEAPLPIHVDDPGGRLPRLYFHLDDTVLIDMIFSALYWRDGIEALPLAIDALDRGDVARFREVLAEPWVFDPLFAGWAHGMQAAVTCNDDFAFFDPDALRAAMARYPRLSRWLGLALRLPACDGWPVRPRDSGFARPVSSAVPVLMLAGALDPVTPPAYAEAALAHLPRGQLHVVPGAAHSVLDSAPCARALVARFAQAPDRPLPALCAGRGVHFDFLTR